MAKKSASKKTTAKKIVKKAAKKVSSKPAEKVALRDPIVTIDGFVELLPIEKKTLQNWLSERRPGVPLGSRLGDGPRAPRVWRLSTIEKFIDKFMKTNAIT